MSRILAVQPVLDPIERDQAAPRVTFDHLIIGQMVTGLVKSQAKGVTLVEIEGQTVALRLPHPATPGDTLRLRFAGNMPQPVFLLDAPETAASDAPQLSQTARMLSDLMQRVPERAPPTLTPPGPLLDQPPASPAELALALRTALVRSGLFYESHLADWIVGQDSLDGLMQEPQNRLAAETARSMATALTRPDAGSAAEQKPVNPMHTLLSQQLQVLESPQLIWRGEVWPGQTLEWQVRQDAAQDRSTAMAAPERDGGWESHLKLTLPQLGTLNVHIKLDANQAFSIRMSPEQSDVAPLLQQNQGQLVEQLAAAGCTLHSLTVQRDAGA
ncbi:MAG TPA: flagellar hook-length control protein FliK [Thiobacillus sp.]